MKILDDKSIQQVINADIVQVKVLDDNSIQQVINADIVQEEKLDHKTKEQELVNVPKHPLSPIVQVVNQDEAGYHPLLHLDFDDSFEARTPHFHIDDSFQ